ncbi:unnamed protein product [Mytilus edulis]|uniref:Uncharacterized protein n=1 Tax=Mytilus edulis TaxID=6550 RepID=A0A8S3RE00_MYTED|nr:unnamed protein product [Mytilus edulis]
MESLFSLTQIRSAAVKSVAKISKEKAIIPPKKPNDNEQEVEEPALIPYDQESCSNQEEQTSILSDILPEQNNCPPIQESGKNTVTLTAEVHHAFDAKLSNKEPKKTIESIHVDKEIRRLYFINIKKEAENRRGKLACNILEPVKDVKAILKTSDHQKEKTEMKPVHATKLTAKRKLFVTSQGNTVAAKVNESVNQKDLDLRDSALWEQNIIISGAAE